MIWTLKKAGMAIAALLVMNAGSARAAVPADVNGDGAVTAADATLALRFAGGLQKPTAAQLALADVAPAAGDGRVNIMDAVRVMRIAAATDPQAPGGALAVSVDLTVGTTSLTRNLTLAGGYTISGTVLDTAQAPVPGYIAFQDTATKAIAGTALIDEVGAYQAVLPAGTYQAIVVTQTVEESDLFELSSVDQAVAAGSAFTLTANVTGRGFTRPNLAAPVTLTAQFSVAGITTFYPITLTLQETETSGLSLNYAQMADIAATPLRLNVPKGTYYVDAMGEVPLSTGIHERFTMYYDSPLALTANATRTFAIPDTEEVAGNILPPVGVALVDLFTEQRTTGNIASVWIPLEQDGNYLMALPIGSHLFSIGFALEDSTVTGEFLQVLSVADGGFTRNIDLPAVPTLRTVSGVVRGPDGAVVSGAIVQAEPDFPGTIPTAGIAIYRDVATTGTDGAYTLRLPRGDYTLTATPPAG